MFDISWTEFLLIGVVALVVIGPKELPAVMRTMGQWTRKVRGMATEFQNQFQEAMREAEMADLKKQVDDMARDVKDIDPLKGVRDDIESVGKDVERSLGSTPEQAVAEPAAGSEPVALVETQAETVPAPAEAAPAGQVEGEGDAPAPPPPETIEKVEPADGTGRPG
jgi:sec-independent protein translocase protein TatB